LALAKKIQIASTTEIQKIQPRQASPLQARLPSITKHEGDLKRRKATRKRERWASGETNCESSAAVVLFVRRLLITDDENSYNRSASSFAVYSRRRIGCGGRQRDMLGLCRYSQERKTRCCRTYCRVMNEMESFVKGLSQSPTGRQDLAASSRRA
jgi:hypothetical protein